MDASTGRRLETEAHIMQSVRDILTTPIGTRVMRREYGSLLPYLVDAPIDRVTALEVIQGAAEAIGRWEPRVVVSEVRLDESTPEAGHLAVALTLTIRSTGTTMTGEVLL